MRFTLPKKALTKAYVNLTMNEIVQVKTKEGCKPFRVSALLRKDGAAVILRKKNGERLAY